MIPLAYQCDGIRQCLSGDDEHMCDEVKKFHKDCSPFSLSSHKDNICSNWCSALFVACSDGRCIPLDAVCNGNVDCSDGWDEYICDKSSGQFKPISKQIPIHFSTKTFKCPYGGFFNELEFCTLDFTESGVIKGCSDFSHLTECRFVSCPHAYKCYSFYCIPLRRGCDGVTDCRHGDDEVACEDFVCTGMPQCRGSNACIPPWEVCDGQVHCLPYHEDEIYCDMCPPGVMCHGLAAQCDGLELPHTMPSLLKALICSDPVQLHHIISHLTNQLTHLIILEVGNSELSNEELNDIIYLPKILLLNAAYNCITTISIPNEKRDHSLLQILNLAFNDINSILSFQFRNFKELQVLILHHNQISVVQSNAFFGLEFLHAIDLTGNNLAFLLDIPSQSSMLHWVESDLMDLCCLLASADKCMPLSSTFSTCENLLHVNIHRVLIYGQALVTLITNLIVIIFQRYLLRKERSEIIHQTVGNICMSCYLMLIAAVDTYYRNRFNLIAISWKYSLLCKVAASCNLVGAESSLSFLVWIVVRRAYTIHFVYKSISVPASWTVCLLIWAVWVLYVAGLSFITSIYLVEKTSNVCIYIFFHVLPDNVILQIHSSVFVVVSMLLLSLLFGVYIFIIRIVASAGKSLVVSKKLARKRQKAVSVHMTAILVFIVLCWLPLLFCQLLSFCGLNMSDAVTKWMAILILPINASFCPIMFGIIPIVRKKRICCATFFRATSNSR